MPRPLRIHLGHHFYGSGNLGDDLMLAGLLAAVAEARVPCEFTCCTAGSSASQALRFPQVTWLPCQPEVRDGAVRTADVWLGAGDTPFQTSVGTWFLDHLMEEVARCAAAGTPMFFLGVGVEDATAAARPETVAILAAARCVWARDAGSARMLAHAHPQAEIIESADLANAFLAHYVFPALESDLTGYVLAFEDDTQFSLAALTAVIEAAPTTRSAWLVQEARPLPGTERMLHALLPPALQARVESRIPSYETGGTMSSLIATWGSPAFVCTSRYHAMLVGAWGAASIAPVARSLKLRFGAEQLGLVAAELSSDAVAARQLMAGAATVPRGRVQALADTVFQHTADFLRRALAFQVKETLPAAVALASVAELESPPFVGWMETVNAFAVRHDLRVFTDWSKVWEYPWLWHHGLGALNWRGCRLLDLGSEISPMPWLLASWGARVTLAEADPQWVPCWEKLRAELGVEVDWRVLSSERLPLADASFDVVTSFSVVEHQADKFSAVGELARVLRPGGRLAISFDICEPDLGMTFPEWNGRALTMREFEEVVWHRPELWGPLPPPRWNVEDAPAFRDWNLRSAPHHNYVVGAAILTRSRSPVNLG